MFFPLILVMVISMQIVFGRIARMNSEVEYAAETTCPDGMPCSIGVCCKKFILGRTFECCGDGFHCKRGFVFSYCKQDVTQFVEINREQNKEELEKKVIQNILFLQE